MFKSFNQISLNSLLAITAIVSVGSAFFWRYPLELLSHFRVYYLLASLLIAVGFLLCQFTGLRSRLSLLLSLALLAFNSSWIVPWYLPNSHQGKGESVRIMAFNINTENDRFADIADAIRNQKPDVAAIVETTTKAKEEIAERLKDTLPFSYRTTGGGLTVLSRLPLIDPQSKPLKGGTILVTSIRVGTKEVELIAAHPLVPVKPSLFARRNALLAEITEYIQSQSNKAIVFLGDINATQWSPYYRRLVKKTGLHNTRLGFGVKPSWIESTSYIPYPGWFTAAIKLPIDHIFVSKGIEVADFKTLKAGNADHRMIWSDIIF